MPLVTVYKLQNVYYLLYRAAVTNMPADNTVRNHLQVTHTFCYLFVHHQETAHTVKIKSIH